VVKHDLDNAVASCVSSSSTRPSHPRPGKSDDLAPLGPSRPALALLTPPEAERFLAEYSRRVDRSFPSLVIGGERGEVLTVSRTFAVGIRA
jgi:hypothetical protein